MLPAWNEITTSDSWTSLTDDQKRAVHGQYLQDLEQVPSFQSLPATGRDKVFAKINKDAGFDTKEIDVFGGIKTFFRGLSSLPRQVGSKAIMGLQGYEGASVVDTDWGDRFIDTAQDKGDAFVEEIAKEYQGKRFLPGISIEDVAALPQNLAYSGITAATGIGTGLTAGAITKSPIAAWTLGIGATGWAAKRMASYEIMKEYLKAKNEAMQKAEGRMLSLQEENQLKKDFAGLASKHGLWEAIPEALGSGIGFRILTMPLKQMVGKSLATRIVAKMAGVYAEELATETVTEMGQRQVRHEAGLPGGKKIDWKSTKDWAESFKNIAPQTFLLTSVMGPTVAGGAYIHRKATAKPTVEPTKAPPTEITLDEFRTASLEELVTLRQSPQGAQYTAKLDQVIAEKQTEVKVPETVAQKRQAEINKLWAEEEARIETKEGAPRRLTPEERQAVIVKAFPEIEVKEGEEIEIDIEKWREDLGRRTAALVRMRGPERAAGEGVVIGEKAARVTPEIVTPTGRPVSLEKREEEIRAAEAKPEFLRTAEDRLLLQELKRPEGLIEKAPPVLTPKQKFLEKVVKKQKAAGRPTEKAVERVEAEKRKIEAQAEKKRTQTERAKTLISWVRSIGGIQDSGLKGEQDQFSTRETRTLGLVKKKGRTFDELGALAMEYGWLPRTSENPSTDFIALLNKDVSAQKQGLPRIQKITEEPVISKEEIRKELDFADNAMLEYFSERPEALEELRTDKQEYDRIVEELKNAGYDPRTIPEAQRGQEEALKDEVATEVASEESATEEEHQDLLNWFDGVKEQLALFGRPAEKVTPARQYRKKLEGLKKGDFIRKGDKDYEVLNVSYQDKNAPQLRTDIALLEVGQERYTERPGIGLAAGKTIKTDNATHATFYATKPGTNWEIIEKPTPKPKPAPTAPALVHDYSSTQVNLPPESAKKVVKYSQNIPDAEIYIDPKDPSFGREEHPHITVKYGLHTTDPKKIEPLLSGIGPIKAKMGKISVFESDKYDTLKIDIESPELHALNKKIADSLEVTDTYPTYKPHATIAYLEKGEGKKYAEDSTFEGEEITLNALEFSGKDGSTRVFELKGKEPLALTPVEPKKPKVPKLTEAEIERAELEKRGQMIMPAEKPMAGFRKYSENQYRSDIHEDIRIIRPKGESVWYVRSHAPKKGFLPQIGPFGSPAEAAMAFNRELAKIKVPPPSMKKGKKIVTGIGAQRQLGETERDLLEQAKTRIKNALKDQRGSFSMKQKEGPAIYEDLLTVGKHIINQGHTKFSQFSKQFKTAMGEAWTKVKHLALKLYSDAKKILKSERGAITITGRGPEATYGERPLSPSVQALLDSIKQAEKRKATLETRKEEGRIWGDTKAIGRGLQNLGVMRGVEHIFKSPEWYSDKRQAQVTKHAIDRSSLFHEEFNEFNKVDDPNIPFDTVTDVLVDLGRKGGISKFAFFMGKRSKEYRQLEELLDEADIANRVYTKADLRKKGLGEDVIRAWSVVRASFDKQLEAMQRPMKKLIDEIEERARFQGKEPVYPNFGNYVDKDGKKRPLNLKEALMMMGQYKGSYAPRIREVGDWVVQGKLGPSGHYMRYHKRTKIAAELLANKLKRDGYSNVRVSPKKQLLEETFQMIKVMEVGAAIERAVKQGETMKSYDSDVQMAFLEDMLTAAADLIKSRGARSTMIRRQHGRAVSGYMTDPIERFVRYTSNNSAGMAKAETANKMFKVLFGEYSAGKKVEGVDQAKEPHVHRAIKNYIEEQLRNPERTDRMIGLAKSVATFKYLGFNPRSILVNITSLVTTAPVSIHQYAMGGKGSLFKVNTALMKASKDYPKVMVGKKLLNTEEQAFMEDQKAKGYTDPQYTREAVGHIQGAYGTAWSKAMGSSMWAFGKSEEWVRGTTMLAAFRMAKKKGLPAVEAGKVAKEASDRAHGVYGKATLPAFAQGTSIGARIGQLTYVYLKFPHNALQMYYDVGIKKRNIKGFVYALAAPAVLAGGAAIPMQATIIAIVNGMLKALGDDRDAEKFVYDTIEEQLGEPIERRVRGGILGEMGVDVSGSLAMGPGAIPHELLDLTGAIGGVGRDIATAARLARTGRPIQAIEKALPSFAGNILKMIRETKGATTTRGYRIWDEKGRPYLPDVKETVLRGFGFRSARRARLAAKTWEGKREARRFNDRRKLIYEKVRAYIMQPTDKELLQEIYDDIAKFNKAALKARAIVPITRKSINFQLRRMRRPTAKERRTLAQ